MVTQINLGSFFNANGRTVVGGSASGLDTESLVKSLTDARLVPATKLQDKIDANTKRSSAISEMKSLLTRFKDAANFLRNPPGVGNEADDIFNFRSANLSTNTGAAASGYMTVTVQPGAQNASYVIDNVLSIAKAKKQETNAMPLTDLDAQAVFAAPAAGQFGAGTITVNGANITLTTGDSLRTVIKKFNDASLTTGISAQAFQIAPGQFKAVFTATQTGLSHDFDLGNPATVTSDPSGALTNVTFGMIQPADNARFDIDNVSIIRETNSISDLVDGVTFNLLSDTTAAPVTAINVDVVPNTEIIKNGITNFVNTYNDFRFFVQKQSLLNSDGTPAEDSVLYGDSTMRNILSSVSNELSRIVGGITGGNPSRLSELGITLTNYPGDNDLPATRNIMTIDDAKLQSAIQSNFDGVRRVFEFDFTSDSANLQVFSRTNALNVNNFTLNIDPGTGTYTATYDPGTGPVTINVDGIALSGGTGYTIKGQAGTPLEGLVMIYTGNATSTVNVNVSQGIGDRIFNAMDDVLKDTTGIIAVDQQDTTDQSARWQTEIDRINEQVAKYRDQLLKKYADLEAAITKVNNILLSLNANQIAQQSNG